MSQITVNTLLEIEPDAEAKLQPTCNFFVTHKKRYCRMLVSKGKRFCGQHLVNETQNDSSQRRIPCPLDPKHSCFENKVEQHIKCCNSRERTDLPYISKGINDGDEDITFQIRLSDLKDSELLDYIRKIEKVHEDYIGTIEECIGSHPVLQKALSTPSFGPEVLRHLKQTSSLLDFLEVNGLLDTKQKSVFIEFGAGRGKLSGWLIEALNGRGDPTFVLIDKGSQRYKVDAKLRHTPQLKLRRIRIDIRDLDLNRLADLEEDSNVVACGKHLCGAATDLSLRCLSRCRTGRVSALAIAVCCHHRCRWKTYVGKEFFKRIGLTPLDFHALLSFTSWAVSGSRHSPEEPELHGQMDTSTTNQTQDKVDTATSEQAGDKVDTATSDDVEERVNTSTSEDAEGPKATNTATSEHTESFLPKGVNRYVRLNLTPKSREQIGRKSKQILDFGRVFFMRNSGFDSRLIQYADLDSTLENIALVATAK